MKVFSKKGYHGSSISDITKEAGTSKALFYHYFKNKKDLLVIFSEKRLQDFLPLVEGMSQLTSAKDKLIFLVDFVLRELQEETEKLKLYNLLFLSNDGAKAIQEAMKKFQNTFKKIFEMEQSLFRELGFSNPELEATYMRSLLQGISLEYMLEPSSYPLHEIRGYILERYLSKKEKL